jgi:multidrug resistance protein, MATE family
MVAKDFAKGDNDAVQDSVCQALFVGILIAAIVTPLMFFRPETGLVSVLKGSAPAMKYAKPYLMIRAFAFLPGILSLVGFSAYRGTLDMVTPTKLVFLSNLINAILDPIFIFSLKMGVGGAALATLMAEIVAAVTYLVLLFKKNFITLRKIFRLPSWAKLEPLVRGGFAMQLRLIAMNITFLAVARVTQGMDPTGVTAAGHALALQTFQMGGVVLFALSTVAQALIPADMVVKTDPLTGKTQGGLKTARATSNRMMSWGLLAGIGLGAAQIAALPFIFKATPMENVRSIARTPAIVASVLQAINGLVFVGEGVMTGCQNFLQLSLSTCVATAGCLWALRVFPSRFGLTGVWMGFGVFNLLRLAGVCIHQFRTSPITPKKIREAEARA